jgi:hypothetical protein
VNEGPLERFVMPTDLEEKPFVPQEVPSIRLNEVGNRLQLGMRAEELPRFDVVHEVESLDSFTLKEPNEVLRRLGQEF